MHLILADSQFLLAAALFLAGLQINFIFCWQGNCSAANNLSYWLAVFSSWQCENYIGKTLQFLADRLSSWHINNLAGYNERACGIEMYMMTSSNGNIFRVTGPLCGEFTGHRWIPRTKASDVEPLCFLWSAPWISSWVHNCEAGDLRRQRPHYDVIVMALQSVH